MTARQVIIPRDIDSQELRGAIGSGPAIAMEGATMGTYWRAQCVAPEGLSKRTIYEAIVACFELVVRQMSHFDSSSSLSLYNQSASGVWVEVPAEFASVLQSAMRIAELSEGAYDPAAAKLIDAYGFGANAPKEELVQVQSVSEGYVSGSWKGIRIEPHENLAPINGANSVNPLVFKVYQPGGVELNLSSIAKGFAVDLASDKLQGLGVHHFLIEVGGELRGHGCKPNGMPWWCHLEKPSDAFDLPETIVALCGISIATSGDLVQQRLTKSGERISHLVDPRTGLPADDELALVTVLHSSCCQADAWATALYVLGLRSGLALAEQQKLAVRFTQRRGGEYSETYSSELQLMLD